MSEQPRSWRRFESPRSSRPFFVGVDFGMQSDYTAICVIEDAGKEYSEQKGQIAEKQIYNMIGLERPELGTPYQVVVTRIEQIIAELERKKGSSVSTIVDATGVGQGVVALMHERGICPYPVTITGGAHVTGKGVPKRDLVVALQCWLQDQRLRIAKDLVLADVLIRELQNFKVKINITTGHDSYEHWREGDHDDLVLSAALVAWYAERCRPPEINIVNPFWPARAQPSKTRL